MRINFAKLRDAGIDVHFDAKKETVEMYTVGSLPQHWEQVCNELGLSGRGRDELAGLAMDLQVLEAIRQQQ